MIDLILNADDFGMTRGVNEGILRAHREGILTSATLMANGAAFDHAVDIALANPSLGVGCHLALVEGPSVAPHDEIPSLADTNGNLPPTLANFVVRVSCGLIRPVHLEIELRAQIQKIRRAGIEPTHLDTHKHTLAHPLVMFALGRVARELGTQCVRKPFEALRDSWQTTRRRDGSFPKQFIAAAAARAVTPLFVSVCRKYDLRCPGRFLGVALTGHLDSGALRLLLESVSEGQTEIMLHPGVCDSDLARSGSRLQHQRQVELDALLDPALKCFLEERGIRLISFRELN